MLILVASFVLAVPPQPQAQKVGTLAEHPLGIRLQVDDAVLSGHGASRTIDCEADLTGALFVWARAEDLDPFLHVEGLISGKLAEDDDSGGGTTACLWLDVDPGMRLRVTVAADAPGTDGSVELHFVRAPETEATRTAAEKGRRELTAFSRGDHAAAKAELGRMLAEIKAVPGAADSADLGQLAWEIALEATEHFQVTRVREGIEFALPYLERCFPPSNPSTHHARFLLGTTYWAFNDLERGRALAEPAMLALEQYGPHDKLAFQSCRKSYAGMLEKLGEFEQAKVWAERTLHDLSGMVSGDHELVLVTRALLSRVLYNTGDLIGSREIDEEVYRLRKQTLPPDHPDLQVGRGNLAISLMQLGDLEAAQALFEESIAELDRATAPRHDARDAIRQGLATVLILRGEIEEARLLLEDALEDAESDVSISDAPRAALLSNLGAVYSAQGRYEDAEEMHAAAAEEQRAAKAPQTLDLLIDRQNLALCAMARGRAKEARTELEAVVAGMLTILPRDDRRVFEVRVELMWASAAAGELASATDQALDIGKTLREALGAWSLVQSPRELEMQVSADRFVLDDLLSFAQQNAGGDSGPLDREAWACRESTRAAGFALAALARRASADAELEGVRSKARRAAFDLTQAVEAGDPARFDTARLEHDRAQRALAAAAAARASSGDALASLSVDAVAKRLAPGEALLTFARHRPRTGEAYSRGAGDRMVAFVLRPSGSLARVDLGDRDEIERALQSWLHELSGRGEPSPGVVDAAAKVEGLDRATSTGERVRQLVFDPVRAHLQDIEHLVVVLDDVLHTAPLDALPLEDGRILGERLEVQVRLSLRELLWTDEPRPPGALVAFGGIDYDQLPDPTVQSASTAKQFLSAAGGARASVFRSGDPTSSFPPLPASAYEVREIERLFLAHQGQESSSFRVEGRGASRAALEQLAPRARWLHLSTHGWFAFDSAPDTEGLTRLPWLTPGLQQQVVGCSPMVLCGLALAGANRRETTPLARVPGTITAEELATLDLGRCELAVLSACETGVGVRRAGQGVASLQRALHMAGARSVITSLWKVQDLAARQLMEGFYRRIWSEGKSRAQALWESKMELRAARDAGGQPLYAPRDWAGWVLTGEPE